jgi:immune inhibitor A
VLLASVAAATHPLGAAPEDTAARLAAATRPGLDPPAMAARLQGAPSPGGGSAAAASAPLRAPERTAADVGRVERFTVLDQTQTPNVQLQIDAELRLVTPFGHWYVQSGRSVDDAALRSSADSYEQTIYPTVQRLVGGGRDIGPVALLHADVPGVAGYFDSRDLYPRWVYSNSNERPTLYLNSSAVRPGTSGYVHTVSHELTHLFHYFVHPSEDTWLKEGLGELAQELVDPSYQYGVRSFFSRPSTQLTAWAHPPADLSVHYQSAYLFLRYFLERYGGPDVLGPLLAAAGRGPSTVDAYLAASGRGERFEDVFRDWTVANLVQDRGLAAGQYGYQRAPDGRPRVSQVASTGLEEGRLPQYGTDYWRLAGGPQRVRFQGGATVPVLGADPPAGVPFWWSQRGDLLDTRLTRELDLRGQSQATLTFDLRYDVEADYDYGYVMVSTDGGTRWQPIAGQHTTGADPTGRNLGVGYNGKSGGSGQWVREELDLTPYAGQRILVRFEYVTDDAYNTDGVAVANVAVPALGWQDDGSGWTAEGWALIENALPQRFAVQLVEYRGDQAIAVRQVPLGADNRGDADLPTLGGDVISVVVVVSALAPLTLQPSRYTLAVEPLAP